MGGEDGPTDIASVDGLLVRPGRIAANGVRGVTEDAMSAALELGHVLIAPFGVENVAIPDSAELCGMLPNTDGVLEAAIVVAAFNTNTQVSTPAPYGYPNVPLITYLPDTHRCLLNYSRCLLYCII